MTGLSSAPGVSVLEYGRPLRIFVVVGWACGAGLSTWAFIIAKGAFELVEAAAVVLLFGSLLLPLHLEVFRVRVLFNDQRIQTHSPSR